MDTINNRLGNFPKIDDFMKKLLSKIPLEEVLFTFFEHLKEKIGFDRLMGFSVDRNTQIMTINLEYSENCKLSQPYSIQLSEVIEDSDLQILFGNDYSGINLTSNLKVAPDNVVSFMNQLPYDYNSSISTLAYYNKNQNKLYTFAIYSDQSNFFTKEHANYLGSIVDTVRYLLCLFEDSDSKSHLFLNYSGFLPTDSIELLRRCPGMQKVIKRIEAVADTESTVSIFGATGTGKELVAESVHLLSTRHAGAFVKVNCGAIPENLLESELFGYEKGAFTGAGNQHIGYFEQANNGTIYLDEIGELSQNAQVKLLNVLEKQEIQRIGSEKKIKLNLRIITATNRDLWEMVKENKFREDLFYRINVFPLQILPLNQRSEDIPILVEHFYNYFSNKFNTTSKKQLSMQTVRQLMNHPWSGNVRQLRHSVERAILESIAFNSHEISFDFLPKLHKNSDRSSYASTQTFTEEQILDALAKSNGRVQGSKGAAILLGINPATLRSRMKALGIAFGKKAK